jgi:2-haloacid dehalogenase
LRAGAPAPTPTHHPTQRGATQHGAASPHPGRRVRCLRHALRRLFGGPAGRAAVSGQGATLAELWRQKQIEYSFIRSLSGRYKPFWDITRDGLDFAAARLGLALDGAQRTQLMNQYACLSPFPENLAALRRLKDAGLPTAILSNGTPEMLQVAIKSAGMQGLFDHVLSVDAVRKYKTHPDAYALAPAAFGLAPERILFVTSNGWDAAGASWYGFTTFWINRSGQPLEALDVAPTATGRTMDDVVAYLIGGRG